jgi:serine/threonine protein kinase
MWSLGIIYAMALNQLPWHSQDDSGLVREIHTSVISYPPTLIPEVAQIIQRCTNRNAVDWPTATELELP